MGRDKPPPPSKADKKKKGKKEQGPPRCECERRCACGNRPERPSHGFCWDGEQQKWVGKGSRDQRIASKLTDKGPKEVKGLTLRTHEKLPSQLLGDWCQREKRPRPRWHPARSAPKQGHRLRCVVPDPKRRGPEFDLGFCPAEAFASDTVAKENAALLALKQTQGSLPLERKLPEPYRSTWLAMAGAKKAPEKMPRKASKTSLADDDAAVRPPKPMVVVPTMDRAYASRAEGDKARRAKESVRNQKTNAREAKKRANPDARVYMAPAVRRAVADALGLQRSTDDDGGDNVLQKLAELSDAKRDAAQHLIGLGFRPGQAVNAVLKTTSDDAVATTEAALAHLCLHVDEGDLPETFDAGSSANLDVVVARKPASLNVEGDFAQQWTRVARLARLDASVDGPGDAEARQDEIVALEATFDVTSINEKGGTVIEIEDKFCERAGRHLRVLVPDGYPEVPAMVLKKGASAAAHTSLAKLAFERCDAQEPMLFDLADAALNGAADAPPPAPARQPKPVNMPAAPVAAQRRRRHGPDWWSMVAKSPPPEARPRAAIASQRKTLPAAKEERTVVATLQKFQVMLVEGGTGCGKTTQIPQFLLEDARQTKTPIKIVVAQPRRVAAVGVAARVAEERGETMGRCVGVAVRGEVAMGPETSLLFCTTGVLLQRLRSDAKIDGITHLIVDEVHERHLDADLLLALLRSLLVMRPSLRVILMSATMDTRRFSAYFADLRNGASAQKYIGSCPVLSIPGFAHPVDIAYLGEVKRLLHQDEELTKKEKEAWTAIPPRLDLQFVADAVQAVARDECRRDSSGAVLVFVSGALEISQICRLLERDASLYPLPLHGSLPAKEQRRAFDAAPKGQTKVVVATNVAETSITIPDVTAVVDSLRCKQTGFDAARSLPCLKEVWIKQDAAKQRKGRAGRVRRGRCYRLCPRAFFEGFGEHTTPEIHRVGLDGLCLQVLSMDLDVEAFAPSLLDPPKAETLQQALRELRDLGATANTALTPLGRHLAHLPCAPRLGKLLVLGASLGVRDEALRVAAGLGGWSPWRSHPDDRPLAAAFRQELRDAHGCGRSDHALNALALQAYARASHLKGWARKRALRDWCSQRGLSCDPLEDCLTLVQQLDRALSDRGFGAYATTLSGPALWRVARAVVAGALYPRIVRIEKPSQKYAETAEGNVAKDAQARQIRFLRRTPAGALERAFLHPASACYAERSWPSPWAVYGECMETFRVSLRDVGEAAPYAVLLFGGRVEARPLSQTIVVDGWVSFAAHARVGALVAALRTAFDALLMEKASKPQLDVLGSAVVGAILRLLLHDGLA